MTEGKRQRRRDIRGIDRGERERAGRDTKRGRGRGIETEGKRQGRKTDGKTPSKEDTEGRDRG